MFDAVAGKQMMYSRQGVYERFMPQNSENLWSQEEGILYQLPVGREGGRRGGMGCMGCKLLYLLYLICFGYRTDRWFYEIIFYVNLNATSLGASCTSLPAIKGLFEVTITGSANTATYRFGCVLSLFIFFFCLLVFIF